MVNDFGLLREELRVRERADRAPHHALSFPPGAAPRRTVPNPPLVTVIHSRAERRGARTVWRSSLSAGG